MEDNPRFRDAKLGIIVSSVRALNVFLARSSKTGRLPDYIIVEGPLAGGHLGFGMDWEQYKLETIVDEGSAAVQVATRFTNSEECGLPQMVKQEYLVRKKKDVIVDTISPTGYPKAGLKIQPGD
ncbi:hypothetical protein CHS0354_013149 [Potamilus streckersoni]|uniref:Uncharacterized protein n=1 Tax=Potamilus streckersoni TaxID=2493646 RepID=A0AAE0VQ81_9BIVA|nr:hypothetical protein CHS0354_013149 [Potamilus streckersoni]